MPALLPPCLLSRDVAWLVGFISGQERRLDRLERSGGQWAAAVGGLRADGALMRGEAALLRASLLEAEDGVRGAGLLLPRCDPGVGSIGEDGAPLPPVPAVRAPPFSHIAELRRRRPLADRDAGAGAALAASDVQGRAGGAIRDSLARGVGAAPGVGVRAQPGLVSDAGGGAGRDESAAGIAVGCESPATAPQSTSSEPPVTLTFHHR
jgi:hypothetical protein